MTISQYNSNLFNVTGIRSNMIEKYFDSLTLWPRYNFVLWMDESPDLNRIL